MKILVTGGAGYIGSHTVLSLLNAGHDVVVVDDYSNSKPAALERVAELAGLTPANRQRLVVNQVDVACEKQLLPVFEAHRFDAAIHFAGLKAVGESVREPMRYFEVNLGSTLTLVRLMERFGCRRLVFSSSATVYGAPETLPIVEDSRLSAESAYGRTKLIIEDMLRDLARAASMKNPRGAWGLGQEAQAWKIALLRYFNPVGAHVSGRIGEDPNGIPNNLFPFVSQVAVGRLPFLSIYGSDYPTKDGTGVRDYLHVVDLAEGHVKAVEAVAVDESKATTEFGKWSGAEAINLGTGNGNTVLEVVKEFSKAAGKEIPYKLVDRRPGDVAACYANAAKAKRLLNWQAKHGLAEMCQDSWRWQQQNPKGY